MLGRIIYKIKVYDPATILSLLKVNSIPIYKLIKIGDYEYQFETSYHYKKKVLMLFKDIKVVNTTGLYRFINNLFIKKATIISLTIGMITFFINSNRIYEITINGTSQNINLMIKEHLKSLGLVKYAPKPSFEQLLSYEKQIKSTFKEYIEFVELRMVGVNLSCSYLKKRNDIELPYKSGAKYASKSGIISHFVVSSGLLKVKENQYVEKGTLLIDDKIVTPNGEEVVVGVEGQVYAYTWTIVDIKGQKYHNENENELLFRLIDQGESLVASQFYKEEKILEKKILKYEIIDNIGYLKLHLTCLEDIAK